MDNNIRIHNRFELKETMKNIMVDRFGVNRNDITDSSEFKKLDMNEECKALFEITLEQVLPYKPEHNDVGYIVHTGTFGEAVNVMAGRLNLE